MDKPFLLLPLLQIKYLSIEFKTESGTASAIKNISLQINKGDIVAIVGESGSGKSVTALSILQLLPASANYSTGEILFSKNCIDNINLLASSEEQLQSIRGNYISMIFQEPMTSLNPLITCGNQVKEAIKLHQRKSDVIALRQTIELFRKVDLPQPEQIINRYPHQLSGGQKQRVMIAIAMCCNPSLLIADEPTTALDVTVQKTILALLKKLQQENDMGVIYITHDLNLVAEIADKVIVMYKGAIVETGNVKEIFSNAQHPYTKALLACRPAMHVKGQRLPVVSDFMQEKKSNGSLNTAVDEINHKHDIIQKAREVQEKILEVKNLTVYFPARKNFLGKTIKEFTAVDEVSFDIYKGETIGLVGESGCGKTTLGRAIIRLIEPSKGEIFFKGKNIAHFPKEEMRRLRKNIQIIFQDPYGSLNPRMAIGSAILEPLKVHGILRNDRQRKEKVMMLMEKVDLKPSHYNRYPHEFSGGQRQRICIARALALNPDFIICDESVSALDVSVEAQVLNLLNDLKKEFDFTSFFISHDLGVVRYISDRIIVMNKGRIEESGLADNIYFNPKKEYTQKLIASIPKGLTA